MKKMQRAFAPKVVGRYARSQFPIFYLGCLVFGAALFLTPLKSQAALFDLTLDPSSLGRTNIYDFYAWSPGASWEVTQSVLAAKSYFNEVFTFDVSPNLIGMHLLDLAESNSYRYNLGYVLVATFGWADDISNQPASGGVPDYSSSALNALNSLSAGELPKSPAGDKTPDNPPNVPEPVTLTFLALTASVIYWKRRHSGI